MFYDVGCPAIVHRRGFKDESEEILDIIVGEVIHLHPGHPVTEKIAVAMIVVENIDRFQDKAMDFITWHQSYTHKDLLSHVTLRELNTSGLD
jgi:hypothetical protein